MLKYAQDVFKRISPSAGCGFNMFVQGDNSIHSSNFYDYAERAQGYDKAEEMANEGKIFYKNVFNCKCGGHAFMYGGFFVCNDCGGKGMDEDWWIIKVKKDGDKFHCVGLGFEDIQSSENHAFGETRKEAIDNYEKIFRK